MDRSNRDVAGLYNSCDPSILRLIDLTVQAAQRAGVHLHHLPRTEDWPGMPVDYAGFTLKPRDFLDRSPVLPK